MITFSLDLHYIQPVVSYLPLFWSSLPGQGHVDYLTPQYQDIPKLPLAQTNRGETQARSENTIGMQEMLILPGSGDQGVNQFIRILGFLDSTDGVTQLQKPIICRSNWNFRRFLRRTSTLKVRAFLTDQTVAAVIKSAH